MPPRLVRQAGTRCWQCRAWRPAFGLRGCGARIALSGRLSPVAIDLDKAAGGCNDRQLRTEASRLMHLILSPPGTRSLLMVAIFKPGPSGRRAALAYGPDVWEVVKFLREIDERGPAALVAAAEVLLLMLDASPPPSATTAITVLRSTGRSKRLRLRRCVQSALGLSSGS